MLHEFALTSQDVLSESEGGTFEKFCGRTKGVIKIKWLLHRASKTHFYFGVISHLARIKS